MNHKVRELILHFGLPKTGTIASQKTLYKQRKNLLNNHNTLYPGNHENHFYFRAFFADRPNPLFKIQMPGLKDDRILSAFLEQYQQEVITEINAAKPDRIIISCEDLVSMERNEIKKLQSFILTITERVILFAYLRDPWSGSISLLQEQILTGYKKGAANFTYAKYPPKTIEKFEDVFAISATAAPYVPQPNGFNVAVDFCERFSLDSLIPVARKNTSIKEWDELRICLRDAKT